MKVLSWNIWVSGYFDELKNFLTTANANIIGLQEVQGNDPDRDVIGFLTALGYHGVFFPVRKAGYHAYDDGPAIFTRYPILSSKTHVLSKENSRGAVEAELQVGDETMYVFCTHLLHTHQEDSPVQMEQAENLVKLLPLENVIVMGDFNAAPESGVIQRIEETLVNTDKDSLPTWSMYPEGCLTCNPQTVHIKLDHIFVSKDLKAHSFKVEQSKASDHLPISVEVEV